MTPAHEPVARALCAAHCSYMGMSPAVLPGYVDRCWREWLPQVPAVLDAARVALGRELLRGVPLYGLDGGRPEPFVRDGEAA